MIIIYYTAWSGNMSDLPIGKVIVELYGDIYLYRDRVASDCIWMVPGTVDPNE